VVEAQPDAAAVAAEPLDGVAEEEVPQGVVAVAAELPSAEVRAQLSAAHLDLRPARSRMTKATQTFRRARQVANLEAPRLLSSSEVSAEGVSWRPVMSEIKTAGKISSVNCDRSADNG
jgi:hypothetical protein